MTTDEKKCKGACYTERLSIYWQKRRGSPYVSGRANVPECAAVPPTISLGHSSLSLSFPSSTGSPPPPRSANPSCSRPVRKPFQRAILLRSTRKTECGAKQFLIPLGVRAAPLRF